MPDRTVEDLVADSVRVLDAAPLEREWRRRAFAALLAFNDEFDTRSGRDVLHEPLARAGLLEAGAKDVRPLPLPEVAVEVCRHLAEPRKRHLVAAWYKVLGISMAERDRLSALRRNAAARELRELARALNAVEVPVSGYEPGGSDVGGSADFAWWFEAPERSREAPSAAEAIAYARALDANQPPATRFGTLVLPEGSNAMCQALAAGGSEVPLALMELLESPSTGYFSSIAAAQGLAAWLKANAKKPPGLPDRAELCRRLSTLVEQGVAAQQARPWMAEGAPQAAFRWIDGTTSSDSPLPLLEVISEAYCRLGNGALPAYRENAQRALDGEDVPLVYVRAVCMQPGKQGLAAASEVCEQLLARREEFAGLLGILGWAPGIRKEVRERLRAEGVA